MLNYVAKCDPSIVNSWIEDKEKPMAHLAIVENNIDVLDGLLQDYGLNINFRNE